MNYQKYFPHFKKQMVNVGDVNISAMVSGSGEEAVLLLHGYPQSGVMWHKIANELAKDYRVVISDLRGYGESDKPRGLADHSNYSKKVMARDQAILMEKLGFSKYHLAGHDRGARVCHRFVRDFPDRVKSCVVMDILPTIDMYQQTDMLFATMYWHWFFLIQPVGFPEQFLESHPAYFVKMALMRDADTNGNDIFPEEILNEYILRFSDPAMIHASCEDYRASATIDLGHDEEDAGKKTDVPLLALWADAGVVGLIWDVLAEWRKWAVDVDGFEVESGHFIPEEKPDVVLNAMKNFFNKHK